MDKRSKGKNAQAISEAEAKAKSEKEKDSGIVVKIPDVWQPPEVPNEEQV